MVYYSQHGEDKYIESLFSNLTEPGVCIEVGAYDGVLISNTYYFEKKGWRALCIEPIEAAFEQCKKVRKECYQGCIAESDMDDKEFTMFKIDNNLSAVSSLTPDVRLIQAFSNRITEVIKCQVKVRSLNSLLNELNYPKDIDFISIDTENTELNVLKGMDLNYYNVKLFVIENNFNEPHCENYLKEFGYKKINRIAVNDFYMR